MYPSISLSASVSALASAMASSNGVLVVKDLPVAPLESVSRLLNEISPELASRVNAAYDFKADKLVFKDAFAEVGGF